MTTALLIPVIFVWSYWRGRATRWRNGQRTRGRWFDSGTLGRLFTPLCLSPSSISWYTGVKNLEGNGRLWNRCGPTSRTLRLIAHCWLKTAETEMSAVPVSLMPQNCEIALSRFTFTLHIRTNTAYVLTGCNLYY